MQLGHTASQESIYNLEKKIKTETDRYIQIGLKLLIEDASPRLISRRFEIEAEGVKNRHQGGIQLFSFMAKASPSFGLVGTLIGLINVLRGVGSDMSTDTLGPSMAVALVTTLYGSLLSFLLFLPASEKLKAYSAREFGIIRIIREAILMIKEGLPSRELEQILNTYLPLEKRKSIVDDLLAKQYKTKPTKTSKARPAKTDTSQTPKTGKAQPPKAGAAKIPKTGKAQPVVAAN